MNKEKLLELSETLRGIAEESNVASFERWHEDGWVNCKFRYRHEPQTPPPDPYAKLKAAHASGKTIQYDMGIAGNRKWVDTDTPDFSGYLCMYRIKPEPQKLPLSQDDVKAGDEFLSPRNNRYQWTKIETERVFMHDNWRTFQELMDVGWKILSLNETEWRDCYKLVEQ